MDFVKYDEWASGQAREEKQEYDAMPVSVLLEDIRNQRYGDCHRIWYSVSERADLRQAGPILMEVLESDVPFLMRFHCASALIAMAELYKDGWKAEELTGEKKYPVKDNLKKVRRIVEDKIKALERQ